MSSFCIYKSYSHFFSKNNCELDNVLTITFNILTTNELVKLTMLTEQLGPDVPILIILRVNMLGACKLSKCKQCWYVIHYIINQHFKVGNCKKVKR